MEKRKLNIAVTGLNNIDSPGPGIPVIRGIRDNEEWDVRIIGLSYETLEPGMYMKDLVDKSYQIPLPSTGTSNLMERIQYIHSIEKIDVLIPNFDAELFNFIKLSDRLESEMGIKTFLPTLEQFEARHKANLYEYGVEHGIQVPKTKMVFNTSDFFNLNGEFEYPLVVKGQYYDAAVAYTPEQAVTHFNKISAKWGLPILIQEFVFGQEVNVTALGDGDGNTVGAVPMRKKFITDKGKAWAGITIEDQKLLDVTHQLLQETKWRGPLELELIKTNEDEYYLLEINPRFPAWVYLAVGAGQNHPADLVRMALGEKPVANLEYEVGKLFIRYSYDLICDLSQFEQISTMGEL